MIDDKLRNKHKKVALRHKLGIMMMRYCGTLREPSNVLPVPQSQVALLKVFL